MSPSRAGSRPLSTLRRWAGACWSSGRTRWCTRSTLTPTLTLTRTLTRTLTLPYPEPEPEPEPEPGARGQSLARARRRGRAPMGPHHLAAGHRPASHPLRRRDGGATLCAHRQRARCQWVVEQRPYTCARNAKLSVIEHDSLCPLFIARGRGCHESETTSSARTRRRCRRCWLPEASDLCRPAVPCFGLWGSR